MTYEEFCSKFQIQLNQQQSEAVQAVQGPVLLLAVPGSGKTTVLVTRLGYMICCAGIAPENILTLTYTVAATHDMEARFCSFFGEELGRRLEFRTINGVCARVIQYYGRLIGKNSFTLVTDEKSTAGMLSTIYRKVEGDFATAGDIKNIRMLITYIKNRMLTEEEIRQLDEGADFKISEIYDAYCGEMRSQGLMDYDDQMTYAYTILRKNAETLQYFQNRYPYICVDEAQDTSKIQHEIIRLLAGKREQLFMVGDEDQSIYGFRAAYPEALLSFEQDHPGAKVLLMEENFRSNAKIVEAADKFIQKNSLRHEKHMRASRPAGADIRQIDLKGRSAQYKYLLKVAEDCRKQTAVLYRDNESVLPLVDLLERRGIPYRIRNAELAFFTHRVVLDIQNIILFAENPKDTELFLKIYYKLSTYISRENAARICEISKEKDIEVFEAVRFCGEVSQKVRENCRTIRAGLKNLLREPAETAVNLILRDLGYAGFLERAGVGDGKLYVLRAIARNEESPRRLLERLTELRQIIKEKTNDPNCKFILSTIHASKGLEYDTVYLMDVIDGIFPENVPEGGSFSGKKQGGGIGDAGKPAGSGAADGKYVKASVNSGFADGKIVNSAVNSDYAGGKTANTGANRKYADVKYAKESAGVESADGKSAKASVQSRVADRKSLMEMFMREKRLKERAAGESGTGEAASVAEAVSERSGSAKVGSGSTEAGSGKIGSGRTVNPGSSHVKTAEEKELETYEEERRLFYVGVTRAKERLFLFTINRKSVFVKEFTHGTLPAVENPEKKPELQIKPIVLTHREVRRKKPFSMEEFRQFCDSLGEGLLVEHKKFGNGVIAELEENWVVIRFEEKSRRFELRTLYENGLLKLQ